MTAQDLADGLHLLAAMERSPGDRQARRRVDEWFGHFGPDLIGKVARTRGYSLADLFAMPTRTDRARRRLAVEAQFADKEYPDV